MKDCNLTTFDYCVIVVDREITTGGSFENEAFKVNKTSWIAWYQCIITDRHQYDNVQSVLFDTQSLKDSCELWPDIWYSKDRSIWHTSNGTFVVTVGTSDTMHTIVIPLSIYKCLRQNCSPICIFSAMHRLHCYCWAFLRWGRQSEYSRRTWRLSTSVRDSIVRTVSNAAKTFIGNRISFICWFLR